MPSTDTPIWKSQTFIALVLYLVTMICNAISRKWGVELNATEIAGFTVAVVGFIAGRQYKQAKLIEAGPVALPATVEEVKKP
jgi:hypothetical protein